MEPCAAGTATRARRCAAATVAIAGAFLALLALHLFEPALGVTWAYAHLGRRPELRGVALALIVLLPAAAGLVWSSGVGRTPPRRPGRGEAAIAVMTLSGVLIAVGLWAPSPTFTLDGWWFTRAIARFPDQGDRWFLAVRGLAAASRWLRPESLELGSFLVVAHGVFAGVALAALAGACRVLARETREQWAMTALVYTAFGVLQISIGYVDIYPSALLVTALFFWTALRALAGEIHPAWPVAIAALGPFVYLGLVLLAPSALVVLLWAAVQPGGLRRAGVAIAAAVAAAGCATLPLRGIPFDWLVVARRAWASRAQQAGFLPDSSLLPFWYLLSAQHWAEVASTLILIDPVGVCALVLAGGALLLVSPRSVLDLQVAVLLAFVAGFLAYLGVMDAVYGAFADWDLFSYCAVGTSLLGGLFLVRFGRTCPRRFGPLLGLGLALAIVHLLARLHALTVDVGRHVAESPQHRLPADARPAPPASKAVPGR